jgi:MFS family permease
VAAAAPALVLLPLLLRLQEPRRGAAEGFQERPRSGVDAIRTLSRIPTLWWIIASGALFNFNMYALGTFMPAFLSRVHHLSLANSGVATGILYAIGGIAGTLIAGRMGDRVMQRRKDGRLFWAAFTTLLAAPTAWLSIQSDDMVTAVAFMTLSYCALCTYYGLVYSAIQDIVAPSMCATAMSIYFMAMYLCGAGFGPLLIGRVSDVMARRAADAAGSAVLTDAFKAVGLQQAMLIMPVFSVLLGLVLYLGSRTIVTDMEKRRVAVAALPALATVV